MHSIPGIDFTYGLFISYLPSVMKMIGMIGPIEQFYLFQTPKQVGRNLNFLRVNTFKCDVFEKLGLMYKLDTEYEACSN